MAKRFLITTADEATWQTDRPVLFLGEWCKLYNRREIWSKLDAEVVPYHWNDRQKYYRDYRYLMNFYERIFPELVKNLNCIHNTVHSIRYWQILLGEWLEQLIQIFFDRWEMIQNAVRGYEISDCLIIENDLFNNIPKDYLEFSRNSIQDPWNRAIYSYIIESWTDVHCGKITRSPITTLNNDVFTPVNGVLRLKQQSLDFLLDFYSKFMVYGVKQKDPYITFEALPLKELIILQLKLGQIPQFWRQISTPEVSADKQLREWKVKIAFENEFEKALCSLIPFQIPTIFLEGYYELVKQKSKIRWPLKPRFIYSNGREQIDEVFKVWVAEKIENGTPLYLCQHGGLYGSGLLFFSEDHEIAICDHYFTWGWGLDYSKKIVPAIAMRLINITQGTINGGNWNPHGNALLVTTSAPRYIHIMMSTTLAGQWLDYFDDLCYFVESLPEMIRKDILVRQDKKDLAFGWDSATRWNDRFPDLSSNDGFSSMTPLIQNCRIFITTYNGTTFLETMASNIPTIMFWNPNHRELRSSAIPYFEKLESVGIFHKTPDSAANKVSEIWDDVPTWWFSPEVQEVREEFCIQFARIPKKPVDTLIKLIGELSSVE